MKRALTVLCIICLVFISGCTEPDSENNGKSEATTPREECILVCRGELEKGTDLSLGPCLSELKNVEWNVPDWSCDVAHQPRKVVDNNALHQCQEYRKERTSHFVEVSPNCEFIRES